MSASLVSGGRVVEELLLLPPLAGVLKRFNAVVREAPPDAAVALELTAGPAAGAADESEEEPVVEPPEASLPELGAAVLEEDEAVCEGLKVGVLEMALVLARDADGSAVLGPCRTPRS